MTVALLHPAWDRSCATCERFLIAESGEPVPDRRTGLPLLRTREPTPCHKCPKVPMSVRGAGGDLKRMRAAAADLTDRDRAAWAFYRKCRAVGRFPDDPLVAWYAAVLHDAYEAVGRLPLQRVATGLEALATQLAKGR